MGVALPLLGERVEMGGLDVFGSIATEIEFHVFTNKPQDVRALRFGLGVEAWSSCDSDQDEHAEESGRRHFHDFYRTPLKQSTQAKLTILFA